MNQELLQEIAKEMPLFGAKGGNGKRSHIMSDREMPMGQLMTEMKSVREFASNEVHRPLLAQAAYAYKDNSFIADQVAPFYGVKVLHGEYRKFAERTFYDQPETNKGKDTPPARIEWEDTLEDFDLTGRALAIYLSNVDKDQAVIQYGSEAAWRNVATMMLTRLLLIDREITVADLYQTSGNYAAGFTATASPLWSDAAAKLLTNVHTGEDALLTAADTMVIGHNVMRTLQIHPAITGATTVGGQRRSQLYPYVDLMGLETYFDRKIIVGGARYNSTPATSTLTLSRKWADYVTICHLQPDPGGADMSAPFVRTFILDSPVVPNFRGFAVKSVVENSTLAGGEVLMVGYFSQEKIFAQKSGYLLEAL